VGLHRIGGVRKGNTMSGMFGEERQIAKYKSVEWYTPAWVFEALAMEFDLDPCSPHDAETFVPARTKYTRFDNGLSKSWFGRVWLNPPYGPDTAFWMRRLIAHGDGIALVFSRTDAAWCQEAMNACSAMLFLAGRIEFVPSKENAHKASGAGAGSVFFAFGESCAEALANLRERGIYLMPRQ
jgi:hypothetical protein